MKISNKPKLNAKNIGLVIGILFFVYIAFFSHLHEKIPVIASTLAVAILMAVLWITEAVPLGLTSLLPIFLFPLLGIMNGKDVSMIYINDIIFLFIGGFFVAIAMEEHNLHKKIALKILTLTGSGYGKTLFGFIAATGFLSMWISNTATTMLMLPVVISVTKKIAENIEGADSKKVAIGLLLAIAYSSSIGGMATLIGTPPNLVFVKIYSVMFPEAAEVSFLKWMLLGLPLSLFMLIFLWFLLFVKYKPKNTKHFDSNIFKQQYKDIGKTTFEQKIILIAFVVMAVLWITRTGIGFGKVDFTMFGHHFYSQNFELKGWSSIFKKPDFFNDGTIAIFISVLLFFIPSKNNKGKKILNNDAFRKIPWEIILLFGGGFAVADGFVKSGLTIWLSQQMSFLTKVSPLILIFSLTLFMSFLTELTSNTASTQMLLPVMASIAISAKINPLFLMLPTTLAASLAFMLPVATPPNAIVFGSEQMKIKDMLATGLILDFMGVIIITLLMYFFGNSILIDN